MDNTMDTLSQVMEQLRKEGYTEDFNIEKNCLVCREGKFKVFHDEFVIDKFYRFEGDSNPEDEATLYAISSTKHDIKGVLVNGAGIYTDDITNELLESLRINR
ncbi:MAG: phosphoribosylpyrophosphate synthetase [Chitinophagales bacterium]|nr:phosphoribosylpyrophosphate synthetase [Chitinophagales bacterium]